MLMTAVRFALGGTLVAAIPFIVEHLGTATGGIALLFPAVTFAGMLSLGLSQGTQVVAQTAFGAIVGLPAVLGFLLGVGFAARAALPLAATLAIGMLGWLSLAAPAGIIASRPKSE